MTLAERYCANRKAVVTEALRLEMERTIAADLAEARRRRDAFAEFKRRDPVSAERIEQTGMV